MKFLKTHSLGNSFIILEEKNVRSQKNLGDLAKKLCDKNIGIGADGILIALPSEKTEIRMRIINSDRSEAQMCGNGIRCFAKYVFEKGGIKKDKFKIETLSGIIETELKLENDKIISIKINLGKPSKIIDHTINIKNKTYNITSLLLGVPHAVIFVDDIDEIEIKKIGPLIENHDLFFQKTNVNFVKVLNQNEIELKTWERGVGISKACGTGTCASVVASNINNKTKKIVTAHLEMGDLFIEWNENGAVYMTGPSAEDICEGSILINY